MPFLHYSDIETQTFSKYELLGLKPSKLLSPYPQYLVGTAASVGLDLDSSALWAMMAPLE
jgi:hypothetical protein